MEVRINGKLIKSIETLTLSKLQHLLQLAEIDFTNYMNACKNYPPDRMKKFGLPMIQRHQATIESIKQEMVSRVK